MGSQLERPDVARVDASVQIDMAPAPAPAAGSNTKLTIDDALTYLKMVKDAFQDNREKYDEFLEIMKDFKAERTDTHGVIARVEELFKGHWDLILGFNTFLPNGYEIKLTEEKKPDSSNKENKPTGLDEEITFLNRVKDRLHNDQHVHKSLLDILIKYRRENKSIHEAYEEVAALSQNHQESLDDFADASAANAPFPGYSSHAFAHQDERSSMIPSAKHVQWEDKRKSSYTFRADGELIATAHGTQRRPSEKEKDSQKDRDMNERDRERDEKVFEHHFNFRHKLLLLLLLLVGLVILNYCCPLLVWRAGEEGY